MMINDFDILNEYGLGFVVIDNNNPDKANRHRVFTIFISDLDQNQESFKYHIDTSRRRRLNITSLPVNSRALVLVHDGSHNLMFSTFAVGFNLPLDAEYVSIKNYSNNRTDFNLILS